MKYLFLNPNNGHMTTYHPFIADLVLTQDMVTQKLSKIIGCERIGTCVEQLMGILLNEGHQVD